MDQRFATIGAQAALRADQFRGRNIPGCNNLCDLAGKLRRVFMVGGVPGASYWIRALLFHQ